MLTKIENQDFYAKMFAVYQGILEPHFVDFYNGETWACQTTKKQNSTIVQFQRSAKFRKVLDGSLKVTGFNRHNHAYIYDFEFIHASQPELSCKIAFPVEKLRTIDRFRTFLLLKTGGIDFTGTEKDFCFLNENWFSRAGEMIYANY